MSTYQDQRIPNVSAMLDAVNQEYRDGKLTRKAYLSKFSRVKNTNSLSNRLKRFGAKVTKTSAGYRYNGVNIHAEIFLDGCVTDFWTIDSNECCEVVEKEILSDISMSDEWETKSDLIYALYQLDVAQSLN